MRVVTNLNENWFFTKEHTDAPQRMPKEGSGAGWERVSLPHTWNAVDGQDGRGEYYRGTCWYVKSLTLPPLMEGCRVYVEVPAASLSGRIYINGKEAAYHEGGYSTFRADVTDFLRQGEENVLAIEVDNSPGDVIYPMNADFTFYGGLYRGVNLITVPGTHFDLDFYGSVGFMATPFVLEDGRAKIETKAWIVGACEDYTVRYQLIDADGKVVVETWRPSEEPDTELYLEEPHLWQGVLDPYLYTCKATLVRRNETVDEVSVRIGIRSFHVDPQKGFFLNGKPMMLRGVSRHQDRLYKGNALTKEEHYEDAAIIREVGANTVRLAHYQHSQDFYDACDEYGFIVWAEIPYISIQSDNPAAHENCISQMKELIYQNYNHPSICFWGISNEITIGGEKPGVVENHEELNRLVKEIDPTRLTTIAHVSMLPQESKLHEITDVEAYNHYFGWYGGSYTDNEKWLDDYHAKYPNRCIGLSEYGAEGIITYQPDEAKCPDYSERYQAEYHEHMAKILMERPWIWASHVWNMFDFGCAARDEGGVAGRNNKGLVTLDRQIKKEAFYVYKAYWSREPFVYLCGRRYAKRAGDTTTIKVYSNEPQVSLYVGGKFFETKTADKIFVFEGVPLTEDFTGITVRAGECTDSFTIQKAAEKPAVYTLKEEDDGLTEGVANWFDALAAEAANAPKELAFPEGYFSIRSKVSDLLENEEAYQIVYKMFYRASGMKMKKGMLGMFGGKTLEELFETAGGMSGKELPENFLGLVNRELNKIKQ